MLIRAYAKINWTLDVLYKRADNYHELDTLMQQISLCDDVELSRQDTISVSVEPPIAGFPSGRDNIAFRAAQAYLEKAHLDAGVRIHIKKRIPVEAGLGGGSTDAAAVLHGLNELYGALSEDELFKVALSIGADVPFCLAGGAARCRGVGERMEPLVPRAYPLLLVKPAQGVSTKELFGSLKLNASTPCTGAASAAYVSGEASVFASKIGNDLTASACAILPEIERLIERLKHSGAFAASMSGSGSCCFGLFESLSAAESALALFEDQPFVQVCSSLGER